MTDCTELLKVTYAGTQPRSHKLRARRDAGDGGVCVVAVLRHADAIVVRVAGCTHNHRKVHPAGREGVCLKFRLRLETTRMHYLKGKRRLGLGGATPRFQVELGTGSLSAKCATVTATPRFKLQSTARRTARAVDTHRR